MKLIYSTNSAFLQPKNYQNCSSPSIRDQYPCKKTLPLIILSAAIYLLYAKLEEEHGLARHAMAVYERACSAVPTPDKYEVSLYVSHQWIKKHGLS